MSGAEGGTGTTSARAAAKAEDRGLGDSSGRETGALQNPLDSGEQGDGSAGAEGA